MLQAALLSPDECAVLAHLASNRADFVPIDDIRTVCKPDALLTEIFPILQSLRGRGLAFRGANINEWSVSEEGLRVANGCARADRPDDILQFIRDHAAEIREALGAKPGEPIAVSACHRPDPGQPATALLCVDEDELDDWWADQGVDVKADAFMRWAMDRHSSYIHIEDDLPRDVRIPVRGTVGDQAHPQHKPEERAAVDDVLAANAVPPATSISAIFEAHDQADGYADVGDGIKSAGDTAVEQ